MFRARPMMTGRARIRVVRRHQRWGAIRWRYSLLLVIALALIGADRFLGFSPQAWQSSQPYLWLTGTHELRVVDAYTGQRVAGAAVRLGEHTEVTDHSGEVRVKLPAEPVAVIVERAGYEAVHGWFARSYDRRQVVALRPTTLEGTITDAETGEPVPEALVALVTEADSAGVTTFTDEDGVFAFRDVPRDARLSIDAGDYGIVEEEVGQRTRVDLKLRFGLVTGFVTDNEGKPVGGAVVTAGAVSVTSDENGRFRLPNAPDSGELLVFAAGFQDRRVEIPAMRHVEVQLDHHEIKGLYFAVVDLGKEDALDRLIQIIDETELNALVVDIKQDVVFYDTEVQFFHDAKAVQPVIDARAVVKKLHAHNIYAIARLVVFKDPVVAENRKDLAIKHAETGEVWRDLNGYAWVNPFEHELWEANIDLAVEAAELGFDEIQYDYVRFPSDGDLSTAEFGREYTEESRVGAITGFLAETQQRLRPTGAKLAADLFGIVALTNDDQGIGQRFADIVPLLDYVCPMIYPSHFTRGVIDVSGEPNDYPYETILISLERAKQQMPGMERKLRPWLQDFSMPGMMPYGPEEVRAQIRASIESGASGWMLWNPLDIYTVEALEPAPGKGIQLPP